jgi:hypothetical protein
VTREAKSDVHMLTKDALLAMQEACEAHIVSGVAVLFSPGCACWECAGAPTAAAVVCTHAGNPARLLSLSYVTRG